MWVETGHTRVPVSDVLLCTTLKSFLLFVPAYYALLNDSRHYLTFYAAERRNCYSPIHSAVYITTGPQPLPKLVLHTVRSSASSFNFQYHLLSLNSYCSCLRLLSRFPVLSIFPSLTCFRRQFLRKMWPIQLAFLLFYCTYDIPFLLDSK